MQHYRKFRDEDLLYLEDLHVGQTFTSDSHTLDTAEIVDFARQFDPQPFHLDDDAAKGSLFGGLAASGWHTAAITMRLLTTAMPLAGGLIGVEGTLGWPRPTRPGDTLHVECTILEITPSRSKPDRGMITVRNETKNQNGEIAQSFVVKMLAWRRGKAV